MYITLVLVSLSYLVPLAVATGADPDASYCDGCYVSIANELVGDWLGRGGGGGGGGWGGGGLAAASHAFPAPVMPTSVVIIVVVVVAVVVAVVRCCHRATLSHRHLDVRRGVRQLHGALCGWSVWGRKEGPSPAPQPLPSPAPLHLHSTANPTTTTTTTTKPTPPPFRNGVGLVPDHGNG